MTNKTFGSLYVIAVPIGNYQDISLRALDTLKKVKAVICEELREGSTLLKKLGIQAELITMNEHDESEKSIQIITRLQMGDSLALVSDCGTPVFADPGRILIDQVSASGIQVIPIPGASSLMTAISVCSFPLEKFIFGGFLSRDEASRRQELTKIKRSGLPVILMDTPYRLSALLNDVGQVFGKGVEIFLACDLTLPSERLFRGQLGSILDQVQQKKCEFILIVNSRQ